MQDLDDNALLREYADRDSEEAFAALVARHVNKVYSVALRHTGNPHKAEEITQTVFVILARKSRHLGKRVILSGWLYQAARLTAATYLRGDLRRARREQEAHMQNNLNENESAAWGQIAPLLDAAMACLNETDRHAVVLRFFDGKSLREVGAVLGANENAARMRVDRALEKLRLFFAKRGVRSTTVIIAGAISANSVQSAPLALAKSVTAAALAKGAVTGGSTLAHVKLTLKLMSWIKMKTAVIAGVVILLAAGTTTVIIHNQTRPAPEPKAVAVNQTEFPRASWRFAGYADPESAFESTFWAMSQGDAKTYLATLAPGGGLFTEAQGKPENEIVAQNRKTVEGLTGYRIIDKKTVNPERVILTVMPETGTGKGANRPGRLVILRINNEWKVSG